MARQAMLPGMHAEDQPPASARPTCAASGRTRVGVRVERGDAGPNVRGPIASRSTSRGAVANGTDQFARTNGLGGRRQFADLPGLSCDSGDDQPARRAGIGGVWFHARPGVPRSSRRSPTICSWPSTAPSRRFATSSTRPTRGRRKEMPDDLRPQFPAIRQMLAAMGVAVLDRASFEADDILATLAHQTEELGGDCYLVTGDKDCRQLISERVKVYNVRKDQIYDACALERRLGNPPGPGRRFSVAGRRLGRQHPGRAAGRTESGRASGWKNSTRSIGCSNTPANCRPENGGKT